MALIHQLKYSNKFPRRIKKMIVLQIYRKTLILQNRIKRHGRKGLSSLMIVSGRLFLKFVFFFLLAILALHPCFIRHLLLLRITI